MKSALSKISWGEGLMIGSTVAIGVEALGLAGVAIATGVAVNTLIIAAAVIAVLVLVFFGGYLLYAEAVEQIHNQSQRVHSLSTRLMHSSDDDDFIQRVESYVKHSLK